MMGNEAHDQYPKKLQACDSYSQKYKLKLIMLIILTNLFTIYIFIGPLSFFYHSSDTNSMLHELNSTKAELAATHSILSELQHRLNSTNLLVQALLIDLTRQQDKPSSNSAVKLASEDSITVVASDELSLALGPHKLPFGYSPRIGSDEIHTTVGAACMRFHEELHQYMAYEIGGECPVDDVLLAHRLTLKGCEPLPRRRCRAKSPTNYVEPLRLPDSLWTTPPDASVVWDPYTCKSYQCLIDSKNKYCNNCFDLQGMEISRWIFDDGGLDFGIDQVLATKTAGTIRIGLDIGGQTGTFAARMRERNVTIITSTLNLDGPFNNFVASRGLIPMHLSISQRLPFFENTLDIVHSIDAISNWIPDTMLEFLLYDIYRVLRPGGLFWLEHFFCFGSQLNTTYVPMLDQIGFSKLRWHAAMKLDRRIQKSKWYISALLEKPII
ncbi:putative S-adenosyl-L-methionine-dependent methyltransferase [Lupinus albus]|uniref:Putative S-adenosyl-L-methionine-dependent methyltransferase n=1 Tax=Lupinus albus TaxID=3870 RepID=A0A6A4NCZ7_LUPAL|nr:putative S-adenosyl-L-methionine-dependent methyltransferase [Lupinus albus]